MSSRRSSSSSLLEGCAGPGSSSPPTTSWSISCGATRPSSSVLRNGVLHGEWVADAVRSVVRLPPVSSAFDYCRALDVWIDIDPAPLPAGFCGANSRRLQAIWVGRESNERRLNFTVAHELGHMHLDEPVPHALWEGMANRFAAALLNPADPFVASVLSAFPGAEIVEIRKLLTPETPPLEPDEEEG